MSGNVSSKASNGGDDNDDRDNDGDDNDDGGCDSGGKNSESHKHFYTDSAEHQAPKL